MFPAINLKLSRGALLDVQQAISAAKERAVKPRLVRVPFDEFNRAVRKVSESVFVPFQPTVLGFPCEPSAVERPTLVCVADDDTNLAQDVVRTVEFSPLGA